MAIDVYPVDDVREHKLGDTTCACDPEVKYEKGEMIIVHNSFDGREGVEWANEILKHGV